MVSHEYIIRAAIHAMVYQGREPSCYRAHVRGEGYVNGGTFATPGTRTEYLRSLERAATSELENMGWAPGYAGYKTENQPKRGILWANWNVFPSGLDTLLERAGYAIEWSDCVSTCGNCGLCIQTEPDHAFWKPSYVIVDSDYLCLECAPEDEDENEDEDDGPDPDLIGLGHGPND